MHRADRFGLSQLYQLRGRVGRSKVRAYSLFTLPAERKITAQAERRLKVLQSLDTLGAGFQLASHDLDIRGAGNLLGEEQSGHIKEVGFELYQQMLEEAVASLKAGITAPVADQWSPQITIGTPVLIPEDYVADLPVRLALYRRLAEIEDEREIEAFGAELADRFGPLPNEVEHLLQIVAIKALCRQANVEKIEAGPKGAVISFRDNTFANPEGLIAFIREQGAGARVRPDMKVVFFDDWEKPEQRLKGTTAILRRLVGDRRAAPRRRDCAAARRTKSALIHHRHHLDLDQLLGLAQLQHSHVGRGRLVVERREVRLITAAALPMSPIRGSARNTNTCTTSLNEAFRGFERLLDALHGGAGLRFEVVGHVFPDLFALVRMVMIDRQRGRAGEPEDFPALDLDRRRERHEHGAVVVRMMDHLHVLVLRLGRRGRERRRGDRENGKTERDAKRGGRADHHGRSPL